MAHWLLGVEHISLFDSRSENIGLRCYNRHDEFDTDTSLPSLCCFLSMSFLIHCVSTLKGEEPCCLARENGAGSDDVFSLRCFREKTVSLTKRTGEQNRHHNPIFHSAKSRTCIRTHCPALLTFRLHCVSEKSI